ncbi:unnamed protein product [Lupinus luteus]|uniref:Uncharacterized protein n=1 Tax=Lupinus luteus TaxID=3873 RepID=A0AAV1WMT4_LUPLU
MGRCYLENPCTRRRKNEATDETAEVGIILEGMAAIESLLEDIGNLSTDKVGVESESVPVDGENHLECEAGSDTIINDSEKQNANDNEQIIQLTVSGGTSKSIEGNTLHESGTSKEMEVQVSWQQSSDNILQGKAAYIYSLQIEQDESIVH